MMEEKIHREIDARGLTCPLPILRARKALSELAAGETARVLSTDPSSPADFASFASQTGNAIIAEGQTDDGVYWFILRRK